MLSELFRRSRIAGLCQTVFHRMVKSSASRQALRLSKMRTYNKTNFAVGRLMYTRVKLLGSYPHCNESTCIEDLLWSCQSGPAYARSLRHLRPDTWPSDRCQRCAVLPHSSFGGTSLITRSLARLSVSCCTSWPRVSHSVKRLLMVFLSF